MAPGPPRIPRSIPLKRKPRNQISSMRRAFSVIRPARIFLIEAEVWPNLAATAHLHRIPLALVNARLSPRSERRYRQFRFFVAPTFGLLDLVCVPERRDVERWAALGVLRNRIHAFTLCVRLSCACLTNEALPRRIGNCSSPTHKFAPSAAASQLSICVVEWNDALDIGR